MTRRHRRFASLTAAATAVVAISLGGVASASASTTVTPYLLFETPEQNLGTASPVDASATTLPSTFATTPESVAISAEIGTTSTDAVVWFGDSRLPGVVTWSAATGSVDAGSELPLTLDASLLPTVDTFTIDDLQVSGLDSVVGSPAVPDGTLLTVATVAVTGQASGPYTFFLLCTITREDTEAVLTPVVDLSSGVQFSGAATDAIFEVATNPIDGVTHVFWPGQNDGVIVPFTATADLATPDVPTGGIFTALVDAFPTATLGRVTLGADFDETGGLWFAAALLDAESSITYDLLEIADAPGDVTLASAADIRTVGTLPNSGAVALTDAPLLTVVSTPQSAPQLAATGSSAPMFALIVGVGGLLAAGLALVVGRRPRAR